MCVCSGKGDGRSMTERLRTESEETGEHEQEKGKCRAVGPLRTWKPFFPSRAKLAESCRQWRVDSTRGRGRVSLKKIVSK